MEIVDKLIKKALLIMISLSFVSCSSEDFIQKQAIRYTRAQYQDFDHLIMCSIDTVTLGDNLDYRLEQAESQIKFAKDYLKLEEDGAREIAGLGGKPDLDGVERARANLRRETERAAAIDSLKRALPEEVLSHPTAYNCCIAYNYSNNLVWVQLDEFGRLLTITKDRGREWLLNPGEDAPGYYEVNNRFWSHE